MSLVGIQIIQEKLFNKMSATESKTSERRSYLESAKDTLVIIMHAALLGALRAFENQNIKEHAENSEKPLFKGTPPITGRFRVSDEEGSTPFARLTFAFFFQCRTTI